MSVGVYMAHAFMGLEGNSRKLCSLPFGFWVQTQVIRLRGKSLYWLSHQCFKELSGARHSQQQAAGTLMPFGQELEKLCGAQT